MEKIKKNKIHAAIKTHHSLKMTNSIQLIQIF